MKKINFTVALILLFCVTLQAQSIRESFVNMPTEILPLLTKNDRLDLVDLYDAKMNTPVTNRLDGKSRMLELTGDYLHLSLSASSSMQIKMVLSHSGDTLFCVVNTVKAEASDSRIRLYTKDWKRVKEKFFSPPAIVDFFIPSDSTSAVRDIADIYLVELKLSPNDNTLVAEYTLPQYMNDEDRERLQPLLQEIVYEWNGWGFERKNR